MKRKQGASVTGTKEKSTKSGRYSEEVKKQAVQRYLEGRSQAEIAKDLGVCVQTIQHWCLRAGISGHTKKMHLGLDTENAALKKENERLKKENEILKKAAAYFAKQSI
jgi:transposase